MIRNIFIYGAGVYGKKCYEILKNIGLTAEGFLVTNKKDNDDSLFGMPIIEYNSNYIDIKNSLIILALKKQFCDEVLPVLKKDGCEHVQLYNEPGFLPERKPKVLIFGVGKYYLNNRSYFYDDEIIGFIDNNIELQGTDIEGKKVFSPNALNSLDYDYICIMSSLYTVEMALQLVDLGIPNNKIISLRKFRELYYRIFPVRICHDYPKPVLFPNICIQDNIKQYEVIDFPICKKPIVSIVIPVYNQFIYTYLCLKSILKHSGNEVPYEIIIADDCSTDQTIELEKVVTNIRVLHNKNNLRFLKNCNNAASYARGKYIFFLNNDTQVQPNWLKPLVDLIERDSTIGMVGSKLIYTDGCLQEAGGIVWQDASAWNFGHGQDPTLPEYNYVKEVDYISGAAIMIRKDLWDSIGGFDEQFCPAYYEDTDLAFEIRRHGYKVMFQPASVVVHFEGKSNGTDLSSGQKKFQVINQKKFYNKWEKTLSKEQFENGQSVFYACDRSQFKKNILVVDNNVPSYDQNAGERLTFMYLKMFISMGLKVTFFAHNAFRSEPYTSILNQMGIHVLYGDFFAKTKGNWLEDNAKYFDFIYLQRPNVSKDYIDIIKRESKAKVFYFAHDLHHIRLEREYQITKNEDTLKESIYWKNTEYDLFSKVDVGHVVGTYEQKVIQDAFPNKPIRNIPLYIYDNFPDDVEKDFSKRKNIIFVGGFGHRPNADGVLWFAKEVFPLIIKRIPDLIWHIAGSNPPIEIKRLKSDNIIIEGYISDEKLAQLYNSCKLAVAPLRYGAGVKGKIVEAAYYQIPLVTTSIGGEGLDASIGAFVIEDNPRRMADIIIQLYNDAKQLNTMSGACADFISKYFTSAVAKQVLLQDMEV